MASALTASNTDCVPLTAGAAWAKILEASTDSRPRLVTVQNINATVAHAYVLSTSATPDDTDDVGFVALSRALSATTATQTGESTVRLWTRFAVWVRRTASTDCLLIAHAGHPGTGA